MKSLNKKGFTLIELLAVILILGIIALIAVPTVSKVIKESKKGAFKSTVENVITAIEQKCQIEKMKGSAHTYIYIFTSEGVTPSIDIKGLLPTSGTITVDEELLNDGFVVSKDEYSEELLVEQTGLYTKYDNGSTIYFNPVTGLECNNESAVSTTETKTGCMKWYAFNDSINKKGVNVILDHNTTKFVAWNSNRTNKYMNEIKNVLESDTAEWIKSLNPRLIEADEIAKIINNKTFSQYTSKVSFYFDTNTTVKSEKCKEGNVTECKYGWLYDRTSTSCKTYGCLNNAEVTLHGYWTGTPVYLTDYMVWRVYDFSNLDTSAGDTNILFGVRPVITIPKSSISN